MGISERTRQRQKDSERKSRSSADQSGTPVTGEPATNVEDEGRVDQVREILFGAQREEYDRRFSRLEELLVQSTSDLSNDTTKKLGAIRDEYDKRFARLEELLVRNISDLSNDTTKKLGAIRDEYDKRSARLEELLVKNISDLSNDTTKKLGAMRDEYDKRFARLEELLTKNMSDLSNDIKGLRHEKVDKATISKLLEEVMKFSNDLNVTMSENLSDE